MHLGLGFFVHETLEARVVHARREGSEGRIAALQLYVNERSKGKRFTVLNVHAPTALHDDDVHERFYTELTRAYDKYKADTVVLLCGDFNAEIGKKTPYDTCVGNHTTDHKRTERGEVLADFCEKRELFVCNTAFEQSKRAKMTHRATKTMRDKTKVVYYRQIDYIICRNHMKGMLTNCRTYGKTIDSDHRLLVARLDLPRYYGLNGVHKAKKATQKSVQYRVDRFKDPAVGLQYRAVLSGQLREIISQDTEEASAKDLWDKTVAAVKDTASMVVGIKKREPERRRAIDDDLIGQWSDKQRALRLDQLSCTNSIKRSQIKTERNRLLRQIKARMKQLRQEMIQEKVAAVDKCKDSARQFEALRIVRQIDQKRQQLKVNNAEGEQIIDKTEAAEYVRLHFQAQFYDVSRPTLDANTPTPQPLKTAITPSEVDRAMKKLKNRRAVGLDGLCAELLKNGPPETASIIANVLNKAMANGEDLGLGLAKLVTLPKPGKPTGPVKNIRPIALLPLLRKVLSLITLTRIRSAVEGYLSPGQSGFRCGRSCADIVWAHRWLIAKTLRYKVVIHILGLDMSRAFDTIDRTKLMTILETVPGITDDDRVLIRALLVNTSLQVQFNGVMTEPFVTNIGSPQGDALSPILFAIYLEAALRELRARGPARPVCDLINELPLETIYADDTDFISLCHDYLHSILLQVGAIFGELNLLVNVDKTEFGTIGHPDLVANQIWREIRKLGSLLGIDEDLDKRIQLARVSFNSLEKLWKHRSLVSERVRLLSYRALVESVLLYNCGTWALTEVQAARLDCCQRSMIRRVLGVRLLDKVTNEALYERAHISPASTQVQHARWRLFGHALRMDPKTPARQAMAYYYAGDKPGRQGNRTTLATVLSKEYKYVTGVDIDSRERYEKLVELAQDREAWRGLVSKVMDALAKQAEVKLEKKEEKRKEAKRRREEQATPSTLVASTSGVSSNTRVIRKVKRVRT